MASIWAYGVLLFLSAALLLAAYHRYVYPRKQQQIRLPPGPPLLPILGHIHLLGHLPHQALFRLAKIYGPLFYLRLGSVPTVVASSPDMAKEFLRTNDHVFASRPQTAAGMLLGYGRSDIGWAPYGSYWRQMRKLCVTELFSAKRLDQFRNVREEEVASLVKVLLDFSQERKAVDIRVKLSGMASNIISRMVMKKRYFGTGGESNLEDIEFKQIFDEFFVLNGVFNIGDYIPYVKWFDFQGYEKRMKIVSKRFDVYLGGIIEEHRRRKGRKAGEPTDLIDVLLNIAEDPRKLEIEMTNNNLKGFILDMFAAGTDTSSVTLEWALAELLKNPRVMRRAREELDALVGNKRQVNEADIAELTYLQSIVKETMRLHPAGPLMLPHESTEACQVGGYDIPAKTRLFVNVWAIGRDPGVWEDATTFHPERFLTVDVNTKNVDVRGKHYELLPFGSGRRGCPGLSLGLHMIHLTLARLLHGFDWVLPSFLSPEDIHMSESFGLTVTKAQPLIVIPQARLPLHVYATSS